MYATEQGVLNEQIKQITIEYNKIKYNKLCLELKKKN